VRIRVIGAPAHRDADVKVGATSAHRVAAAAARKAFHGDVSRLEAEVDPVLPDDRGLGRVGRAGRPVVDGDLAVPEVSGGQRASLRQIRIERIRLDVRPPGYSRIEETRPRLARIWTGLRDVRASIDRVTNRSP